MSTTWGQLSRSLVKQAKAKNIPLAGHFELISRCNLQCKMCYVCRPANDIDTIRQERSAEEWIRLAAEARDAGMLYLLLTGGEVFLRQDFREIYEGISGMGFCTQIYTNATLITPETARWLGRIPPSKIGVTLYGASPETYGKVCGNSDYFKRAMRGVDLLLSEGVTLELRFTVIRDNIDDFDKLADFAEKRGVELGIVNYVSPRREGCTTHPEEERLFPGELARHELCFEERLGRRLKGASSKEKPADCVNKEETGSPFRCTAGKSMFWVTWNGRMIPCGLMDNPFTLPLENGFAEAWEELQSHCLSIPLCEECRQCTIKENCMACPARLINETGSYDKKATYLCELAKERKRLKQLV